MYQVTAPLLSPLPKDGPVLLLSDHTSFSDPMVLQATVGRPIIFVMAREIYDRPYLRWMVQSLNYIPVRRDKSDARAVRDMLHVLKQGAVVGIFPEGGIDEYREESGHRGVGYLALKTGAPVVPVSIIWDRARPLNLFGTLLTPGKAVVWYGAPIGWPQEQDPTRERIRTITANIMQAIERLRQNTRM